VEYQHILDEIFLEIQPYLNHASHSGSTLDNAKSDTFAMSLHLLDGTSYHVGESEHKFSIQSISKVFSFTEALRIYGADIYTRVGREPSGDPFNSLVLLEHEEGIPRNPFINAGAIVVADALLSHYGNVDEAYSSIEQLIRTVCGDKTITFDRTVWFLEYRNGHRNMALAYLMKSFNNLRNSAEDTVKLYCKYGSIMMSTALLSRAMLFLANHGIDPTTNEPIITSSKAKRINSLMLTCGHYDTSGDFAFRVGLPSKSGTGGAIVAVVPHVMTLAVYAPKLNQNSNPSVAIKALELFAHKTSFSIF